jgi:hypothetical protein
MLIDLSFWNNDFTISGVLAFLVGMVSVMVYNRIRSMGTQRKYHTDETIVEAIVQEYSQSLQDYDKMIADFVNRLDILEVRARQHIGMSQQHSQQATSQESLQLQPHVAHVTEPVTITQHATVIEDKQENNGTTDYILKLLVIKPRTSREVQHAIGRTREHTSRLMKKLHDSGFVSRDVNSKPFKYTITDLGRDRLKEKTEVESAPPAAV